MPLDFFNANFQFNAKSTIFASSSRLQCRLLHIGFYVIGLAAKAACSLTGLFLFCNPLLIKRLRNLVFIPIRLIKAAHEEGWLRSLAYFVRLKSLYVNNTHYGFNLRGLGGRLNCSPAALSKHLKVLRRRGLVADHSGNMTFTGFKKLRILYGGHGIGVPVDHSNQLTYVRAQLIRFNLSQQEYNIKRSGVQKCPKPLSLKAISERINGRYAGLSAHGFGKVLGLSPAQGAALRSKMVRLRILASERKYRVLSTSGGAPSGGVLRTALMQGKESGSLPKYAFIKDGRIVVERRLKLAYLRA